MYKKIVIVHKKKIYGRDYKNSSKDNIFLFYTRLNAIQNNKSITNYLTI